MEVKRFLQIEGVAGRCVWLLTLLLALSCAGPAELLGAGWWEPAPRRSLVQVGLGWTCPSEGFPEQI